MISDIKKYVNDKNNYNYKKYVTEHTKDLKEVKLHAIVAYKSNGKLMFLMQKEFHILIYIILIVVI